MRGTALIAWVLLGVTACGPTTIPSGAAQAGGAGYLQRLPTNDTVIVFVHGIFGDAKDTWRNAQTGAYWPRLLLEDNEHIFRATNIYVYQYPSPIFGKTYSIDELAENMRLVLTNDGVFTAHKEVVFLAHSMGGLVVRSLLVKYERFAEKVRTIYFFATPTTGSAIANIAALVSRNPQLGKMIPMSSEDFLADLQRAWLAKGHAIASYCAYEGKETYGVMMVEQASASNLCNRQLDRIDEDHIDIVKPSDQRHLSYMAFRSAFMDSRALPALLPTQDRVSLTCRKGFSPPMPPYSHREVLELNPTSLGGFTRYLTRTVDPGGPWPRDLVYRCEVKNHGSETLFNLALVFALTFKEAMPGATIVTRQYPVDIFGPLESGSGGFEFYISNRSSHFVDIGLPEYATLQDGRRVRLERAPPSGQLLLPPKDGRQLD
jgi:pimeloyl-ACP methyl ester carboxylesterase